MSRYEWAEDDFLPVGVTRLTTEQPEDGRTYVMYHGTTRASAKSIRNNGFQRSSDGMLGPGVYLSRDLEKARRYPINHPDKDRVIIKVKVNVGCVIVIKRQNHPLQKTWSSHGYDTAWVPPNCGMVKSGLEENCIWDPRRIHILSLIKPQPLPTQAEDDFLPVGVTRLTTDEPEDGRTYVMYHGTTRASAKSIRKHGFQRSSDGLLGPGVYLSRDLEKARRYPIDHPDEDKVIIKVKVDVGRVITIRYQNHPLQKTWSSQGYDTAWVPPNCGMVKSGLEEDCVWDPRRIHILSLIELQPLPTQRF